MFLTTSVSRETKSLERKKIKDKTENNFPTTAMVSCVKLQKVAWQAGAHDGSCTRNTNKMKFSPAPSTRRPTENNQSLAARITETEKAEAIDQSTKRHYTGRRRPTQKTVTKQNWFSKSSSSSSRPVCIVTTTTFTMHCNYKWSAISSTIYIFQRVSVPSGPRLFSHYLSRSVWRRCAYCSKEIHGRKAGRVYYFADVVTFVIN